jgi:hypothetical protein
MPTIERLPSTDTLNADERIVIDVRYYNEANEVVGESDLAHTIDITIRNSLYLKTLTENYSDPEPFGKGELIEYEVNNSGMSGEETVYSTKIEKKNYALFPNILLGVLKTKVENISVRMETESKTIEITEEIMKYILSNFKSISLNFSGVVRWIPLPEVNVNLDYLSIENANLIVKQTILSCETSLVLRNCIFMSNRNTVNHPGFMITVGKEATLSNIKIANRVFIGISGKEARDIKRWSKTTVTISEFVIGFEDTSRNDRVRNGFYDAILSIVEIKDVLIAGIHSLNDIPYYPLVAVKKVNEANISNITRSSKNLPAAAPGIQLGEYVGVAISIISYTGVGKTFDSSSFIRFTKVRIDSSLSIVKANIINMALLNLSGITCQKINIGSSVLQNKEVFYNMKTGTIASLVLSNVTIVTDELYMKALSLSVLKESDIEAKNKIELSIEDTANISDSSIKSKNVFNMILGPNVSSHVNNTALVSGNDFKVYTEKDDDEQLSSNLSFNVSSLTGGKVHFNNINSLRFEETELMARELNIENCNSVFIGLMLHYREVPLPVSIKNSDIRLSTLALYEPGNNGLFNLLNCKGIFNIEYLDDISPSSISKLILNNSIMNIHFDAVINRKVYITSENSLGSIITGENDGITLIPDIRSVDRTHFERASGKAIKKPDKIVYGIANGK